MEKTLLDIVLILLFTKIGGSISRKLKMPEVLGSLVAGLILGPIVLNLVQYDNNIKLLSNLGVIMLMFLAGLETNAEEMKKAGLTSFTIALAGIILPLILGTLGAYLFFSDFWENLFVGVILTATSVSITVETLKELGKLNTRTGVNILGAAVIDDVLGLILISIVLAIAQTGGPDSAASGTLAVFTVLIKIIFFCLFSIVGILYLPKYINKFFDNLKKHSSILPICIACGIFMAYIAELLGIAAITGAYICGLILSTYQHKEHLEKNVKAISSGFLSLIFFASVGIEVNINGLTWEVLLITLIMFILAVVGKIAGCGGAARLLKMTKSESVQIGIGMVSRGEVAIITAKIGLQKGILSEEIFLPTLIVVILTTIITPVLLKISFSHRTEMNINS